MLSRYLLAPVRGLALAGFGLLGLPLLLSTVLGVVLDQVRLVELSRRPLNGYRALVRRWCEIEVPVPYRPPPPPPEPEHDGWYRYKNTLYRTPKKLAVEQRWNWLFKDPATYRDGLWMLVNPVCGALTSLLPSALVVAGFVAAARSGGPVVLTVALAAAGVLLGLATGPALMRLHGRWTRLLLAPATESVLRRALAQAARGAQAAWRLALTVGFSIAGLVTGLSQLFTLLPVLLWAWPTIVLAGRQLIAVRRRTILDWTGIRIEPAYRPEPPLPPPRPDGSYQLGRTLYQSPEAVTRARRYRLPLRDPATWRELLYLLTDVVVAVALAALPVGLIVYCFFGLVWSWAWTLPLHLFADFDGSGEIAGLPAPVAGVVGTVAGLVLAPPLLQLHGQWSRLLLGPTKSAVLAQRVRRLDETRTEARDALAAELRRIERDLHDGAQARWVAMGMQLGALEQLIDREPELAKKLVVNARDAAASALTELRALVRGINPPVLAERGLADAIRALALDSPLAVDLRIDLPGRPERPLESAVYFAVSELLANVGKHAEAERVAVELRHHAGVLHLVVVDDGRGGAEPGRGSGLRGIQRRVGTFDGTLALDSPPGGPTTVTLEIPCVLSS